MRKQFLWIDKAGYYYEAPANVDTSAGSKGTISVWYHPAPVSQSNQTIWEVHHSTNNQLRLHFDGVDRLCFSAISGGVKRQVQWDGFNMYQRCHWMLITCTWDFTMPGAGKLRLYSRAEEAPMQTNDATAPQGSPVRLYLGAKPDDSTAPLDGCFDNLAVWNEVMTRAQHEALYQGATDFTSRQNARRRPVRESDGTGTLTLLATFDGRYDAEFAAGDPTASWLVAPAAHDQFCRLDHACPK